MKHKEMNCGSSPKKHWERPALTALDIKKDTFAGTGSKIEQNPNQGPPNKKPT